MPTPSTDLSPTDRQPRVRRTTGLIAAGAALAVAAVAVPAFAATTDPQTAGSTETTVTAAAAPDTTTSVVAPETTTTSTTEPAPPTPTPEEQLTAQLAVMTPEQQLAFDLYTASQEERDAWAAYIAPPPPEPEPAPAPVASGGGTPPNAFLACVRSRESGGNYSITSADGTYRGAYQFSQSTWNNTASHAGRGDLVGRNPATVAPADQDAMAASLYAWQGSAPWGGSC